MSRNALHRAITGKTWGHVPGAVTGRVRSPSTRARLTEERVKEARRLQAQGWSYPRLAERYKVGTRTIHAAVTGKSWTHVEDPPPVQVSPQAT